MSRTLILAAAISVFPFTLPAQVSQQWASRYGATTSTDRATALAVDSSGNVFVTGSSQTGGFGTEDYATIKYNSAGTELWVKRYNGLGTSLSTDIAHAIVVDKRGYIYVTGESLASNSAPDFFTIKYKQDGDTLWTARYNGSRNAKDIAYDIAVSDSGYVYVTGSSEGLVSTHGIWEDYTTVKYDSLGVQVWARSYNGPGGDFDAAYSVAVDASGNVYVTGESGGGSAGSADPYQDYATIKYNAAGVLQWSSRYTGTYFTTSDDRGSEVTYDGSGNVYVTGKSSGTTTGHDYTTVKYNSTGVQLWAMRYTSAPDNNDEATAIALDDSANVYVTGISYAGAVNGNDIVTVKYSTGGVERWAKSFNGAASGNDGGTDLTLDSSANVYVTGHSTAATTAFDYATIKYNRAGTLQWSILYTNTGAAGSSEEPAAVQVDRSGNVYVTGISALDYATVKYSASVGVTPISSAGDAWDLYPNPTMGRLYVQARNALYENAQIRIVNMTGQILYNGELRGGKHSIDVSAWQTGVYFITLWNAHTSRSGRFIVQ